MKRFIDLRGQIIPDEGTDFAWYCTVVDRFEEWGGEHTWTSKKEFFEVFEADSLDELMRYGLLIPDWVP